MSLETRFPALSDLRRRARRRIPHFVWEYLDSATGDEATLRRNRADLDTVLFTPRGLLGDITPNLETEFLGKTYAAPFGIAPVGMSGLIWPKAEQHLSRFAKTARIPYSLSTVATQSPDDLADNIDGNGWFQLYPPRDESIRRDILRRAKEAGFETLVVTIDVPAPSRRERQTRAGLTQPPKLTPRLLAQVAFCPIWAMGITATGMPRMKLVDEYAKSLLDQMGTLPANQHIGYLLRTAPDVEYLQTLRREWDGPIIVKGVMHPDDAKRAEKHGADAIWVSNHAGRQFAGSPSAIAALPAIRAATQLPLVFDSGIEGGLDMMRARALGADFVMMGRAWHYALGAIGAKGPAYLFDMLMADLKSNMAQLGLADMSALPGALFQR